MLQTAANNFCLNICRISSANCVHIRKMFYDEKKRKGSFISLALAFRTTCNIVMFSKYATCRIFDVNFRLFMHVL